MSRAVPFVVVIAVFTVAGGGCETTRSTIEIPACADRVEVEGQATELSSHRFELDHTFDLPFSRTRLQFTDGASPARTFDVTATQPDPLRLFFGAAVGVVGGLLVGSAVYDVANGRGIFEERPFYETLWGSGLVGLGLVGISTGWHPPRQEFSFPDDVCPG